MTTPTPDALIVGYRIGQAIARDVLANGLPREWTGLDAQDGDQLLAAGIVADTKEWRAAERCAKQVYLHAMASHDHTRETT